MYKRIISRLDIKNGILVKGISLEGLRKLGDPIFFSKKYYNDNVDEIHFQDVVATLYGRDILFNIIEKNSRKIFVNVSVGGGIKNENDIDNLLRLGCDKVVINSEAVRNPNFLDIAVKKYGSSTICLAVETIKINNNYEVMIDTGREKTGLKLFDWVQKAQDIGVGEINVTEITSEGRGKGFNIQLYKELRNLIKVQLVAHGGAGSIKNLVDLFKISDVDAVSIASMFHYHYLSEVDTKDFDSKDGSKVYAKNFNNVEKEGYSIKKLKEELSKNGIKIRI